MSVTPRDLAATLRARARVDAEAAAHRGDALRLAVQAEAAALIRAGSIRRAWLIGSLAWGGFGTRSDVDLVVEGLAVEETARLWARLGDRLQAGVDLLRLEDLPESFGKRVMAEGVELRDR